MTWIIKAEQQKDQTKYLPQNKLRKYPFIVCFRQRKIISFIEKENNYF